MTGYKKPEKYWLLNGLCWFAYVIAYFGRVNFSITLPYFQNIYGYSKASLGLIASGFFIAYAAGQLINGILGDHFNPRRLVAIGLLSAGISNILFGFARGIVPLLFFWTANGYFQSMLWGPLVRITTESTPPARLQRAATLLASSTILGYILSYTLVGKIALYLGWKLAFFIPGIILILGACFWYRGSRIYQGGSVPEKNEAPRTKATRDGFVFFIIRSGLWITALISVFQGSLKEGLTLWGPTFFAESQQIPMAQVLSIMTLVPVMNLIALLAGSVVNRFFKYHEKKSVIFFLGTALFFVILLRINIGINFTLLMVGFYGLLASIFAVNNMLTTFVPLNFKNEGRISAAAGTMDCAVYIGAALAGPFTGLLVEKSGWTGIINVSIAVCVAALAVTLVSRNYKIRP